MNGYFLLNESLCSNSIQKLTSFTHLMAITCDISKWPKLYFRIGFKSSEASGGLLCLPRSYHVFKFPLSPYRLRPIGCQILKSCHLSQRLVQVETELQMFVFFSFTFLMEGKWVLAYLGQIWQRSNLKVNSC